MEVLKVSGKSVPKSVAGAIAQVLRREPAVSMQAVGPDAVNQAIKSIAIARSYLEGDFLDVITLPSFEKIEIEGALRTAIKFDLERRNLKREGEG
ncbi:MAG: stage V sporulation protein S [Armatimonadetes bacterium]|nr:stage V sporulation protein S [Armatimonadota bacterium]